MQKFHLGLGLRIDINFMALLREGKLLWVGVRSCQG